MSKTIVKGRGARGFRKLREKFVTSVNDKTCNMVRIRTACGKVFEIEATVENNFIPVLSLREVK